MRKTKTGRGDRDKRRKMRQERKVILIVCERKNETERIYFKKFKSRNTTVNLDIPRTKFTEPKKLVEFAMKKGKTTDYDSIWCVFDVDANSNENIIQAKQLADNHNIHIALSNPSFEFWFLLHYKDCRKVITNNELVEELCRFLPDYSKIDESTFAKIQPGQECAISRAGKINQFHIKNGNKLYSRDSNPSTQVFKLVLDIVDITEC
ncbi:MAG: RloB family protein [Syntrophomonadaceae bacterium]|nr:RloB family protein [Syntrophomonadaceae bacterium]